jgi:transposase
VRAHQHAAGAAGGQHDEALGRSRGGFSTKIHVRAEGAGRPMAFVVSGGERHESRYVEALLAGGAVRRTGRGRPRVRPAQIVGDKGYSYSTVRQVLRRRGIRAVIPRRRDQRPGDRRCRPFDHAAYRERNRVERLINRLKQRRRLATRYEKRAAHFVAMLTLAAVSLWL